jgi:hypothetical protein
MTTFSKRSADEILRTPITLTGNIDMDGWDIHIYSNVTIRGGTIKNVSGIIVHENASLTIELATIWGGDDAEGTNTGTLPDPFLITVEQNATLNVVSSTIIAGFEPISGNGQHGIGVYGTCNINGSLVQGGNGVTSNGINSLVASSSSSLYTAEELDRIVKDVYGVLTDIKEYRKKITQIVAITNRVVNLTPAAKITKAIMDSKILGNGIRFASKLGATYTIALKLAMVSISLAERAEDGELSYDDIYFGLFGIGNDKKVLFVDTVDTYGDPTTDFIFSMLDTPQLITKYIAKAWLRILRSNIEDGRNVGAYVVEERTFQTFGDSGTNGWPGGNGGNGVYIEERGKCTMRDCVIRGGNGGKGGKGGNGGDGGNYNVRNRKGTLYRNVLTSGYTNVLNNVEFNQFIGFDQAAYDSQFVLDELRATMQFIWSTDNEKLNAILTPNYPYVLGTNYPVGGPPAPYIGLPEGDHGDVLSPRRSDDLYILDVHGGRYDGKQLKRFVLNWDKEILSPNGGNGGNGGQGGNGGNAVLNNGFQTRLISTNLFAGAEGEGGDGGNAGRGTPFRQIRVETFEDGGGLSLKVKSFKLEHMEPGIDGSTGSSGSPGQKGMAMIQQIGSSFITTSLPVKTDDFFNNYQINDEIHFESSDILVSGRFRRIGSSSITTPTTFYIATGGEGYMTYPDNDPSVTLNWGDAIGNRWPVWITPERAFRVPPLPGQPASNPQKIYLQSIGIRIAPTTPKLTAFDVYGAPTSDGPYILLKQFRNIKWTTTGEPVVFEVANNSIVYYGFYKIVVPEPRPQANISSITLYGWSEAYFRTEFSGTTYFSPLSYNWQSVYRYTTSPSNKFYLTGKTSTPNQSYTDLTDTTKTAIDIYESAGKLTNRTVHSLVITRGSVDATNSTIHTLLIDQTRSVLLTVFKGCMIRFAKLTNISNVRFENCTIFSLDIRSATNISFINSTVLDATMVECTLTTRNSAFVRVPSVINSNLTLTDNPIVTPISNENSIFVYKSLGANDPGFTPYTRNGLVGFYTGNSYNFATNEWEDTAGNKTHAIYTSDRAPRVKKGIVAYARANIPVENYVHAALLPPNNNAVVSVFGEFKEVTGNLNERPIYKINAQYGDPYVLFNGSPMNAGRISIGNTVSIAMRIGFSLPSFLNGYPTDIDTTGRMTKNPNRNMNFDILHFGRMRSFNNIHIYLSYRVLPETSGAIWEYVFQAGNNVVRMPTTSMVNDKLGNSRSNDMLLFTIGDGMIKITYGDIGSTRSRDITNGLGTGEGLLIYDNVVVQQPVNFSGFTTDYAVIGGYASDQFNVIGGGNRISMRLHTLAFVNRLFTTQELAFMKRGVMFQKRFLQTFVSGTPSDSFRFPVTVDANYTIFYVARYNGPNRGTVFIANEPISKFTDNNTPITWFSGFRPLDLAGNTTPLTGVAWRNYASWVTGKTDVHGNNFFVGTDQYALFRSNGTNRTVISSPVQRPMEMQLQVNYQSSHPYAYTNSDWAISAVMLYNRKLSLQEITAVESYLTATFINGDVFNPRGN